MTGSLSQTRGRPEPGRLIPIGTLVPHYGRIGAIRWTGGERFYDIVSRNRVVSSLPECVVRAALSPADDGGAR